MTVSELIDRFLLWCERNRKPATVRCYDGRLASLKRRLGDREVSTLKPLDIHDWLADAGQWPASHPTKAGQKKAPDTRRLNVIVFETWQKWCVTMRELDAPIIGRIEKPAGRMRDRIPTDEEIQQILAIASPAFALLYRAMLQSGARPGELCRATLADVQDGLIVLQEHKTAGKTRRPRKIAIGRKLGRLIARSTSGRDSGPLFLDDRGRPWTAQSFSAMFRGLRNRLGLSRDLVLYCARHRHLTDLCNEAGIYAAQQAAGHANIQMTTRYLHPDDETLRANQDLVGGEADDEEPPAAAAA